jgi:HSP20 family protein
MLRSPPTKRGVKKMAEKKAKEEKKESRELAPFPSRRSLLGAVDEMERLFDRYVGGWGLGPPRLPRLRWPEELEVSFPDVDVFEEGNEVVVKAEMPGVKKGEVDIELTEDSVTISGEKKKEEKVEKKDYYRVELLLANRRAPRRSEGGRGKGRIQERGAGDADSEEGGNEEGQGVRYLGGGGSPWGGRLLHYVGASKRCGWLFANASCKAGSRFAS